MSNILKKTAALLMMTILVFSLGGCTTYKNFYSAFFEKDKAEASVLIGVFEPFSGSDAAGAADEIAGIELAHSLYGRVLGLRVDLIYGDNQSGTEIAPKVAQELVDAGAKIVLGSYKSVLSLAASDVFRENKVPAICISAKNPLITQTNPYYFRVCYIDAYEGRSAANYVTDGLKETKAALLLENGDDYGATLGEQFANTMEAGTGSPDSVVNVKYDAEITDFKPVFEQISAQGVDVVFFSAAAAKAEEVIRQAYEAGFAFTWIGDSRWNDISYTDENGAAKNYMNGVSYVEDYDISAYSSDTTQIMLNEYSKINGEGAVPSESFAFGFDAYLLALAGIQEAGTTEDSALIANKLTSVYELEGATGSISMNAQGDPIRNVIIEQFTPQGTIAVYTETPKWGE